MLARYVLSLGLHVERWDDILESEAVRFRLGQKLKYETDRSTRRSRLVF